MLRLFPINLNFHITSFQVLTFNQKPFLPIINTCASAAVRSIFLTDKQNPAQMAQMPLRPFSGFLFLMSQATALLYLICIGLGGGWRGVSRIFRKPREEEVRGGPPKTAHWFSDLHPRKWGSRSFPFWIDTEGTTGP